jgi:tripartite-type tricarboxylate transporter receptor subunit TctC
MNRRTFVALAGSSALTAAAKGQERYPTQSLRLIIPFAVGGSTDILARISSQVLTQGLRKSVVPDNVTGAGGVIGAQRVLSAPADGYTIMAGTPGPITINPVLLENISYNAATDFKGIVFVGESPVVVVVRRESPFKTLPQLIDAARAAPGKLTYASAGVGSFAHLSGELFNWRAGLRMVHVPYRGTAPAATDLMAARADVMFENYPSVQSYLVGNQMRALAVGTLKPTAMLPDIPTVAESGVPNYENASWFGLFARTGTPRIAVETLNKTMNAALGDASVKQQLARLGVEPVGGTPEAFDSYLASKLDEMRQLAKASGIKLE